MELGEDVQKWVHAWHERKKRCTLEEAKVLRKRTAEWLATEAKEKNKYLGKKRGDWFALFEGAVARHTTSKKLSIAEESAWAVLCHERSLAPELWLASEGGAFAVRAWMGTWKYDPWGHCLEHSTSLYVRDALHEWQGLRQALVKADDARFDEAARVAKGDSKGAPVTMRAALAYALADGTWARELAAEWEEAAKGHAIPRGADAFGWGLLAAADDPATAERILRVLRKLPAHSTVPWQEMAATLLARVGDAALGPLVELLDRAASDREAPAADIAKVVGSVVSAESARAIATHLEHRDIRPVVLGWVDAHPALGVAAPEELARSNAKAAEAARRALRQAMHAHPEVGSGGVAMAAPASPEELPSVLVTPPWLGPRKKKPQPIVAGLTAPDRPERVVWKPREREEALDGTDIETLVGWSELPKKARAGSPEVDAYVKKKIAAADSHDWQKRIWFAGDLFAAMSEPAAAELLNGLEDVRKLNIFTHDVARILAKLETRALPGLLRLAQAWPQTALPVLARVDSVRLAQPMADALARMKKVGPVARGWLMSFPETAALALVPLALEAKGAAAQGALRVLAEHRRDVVLHAAATYGPAAEAGVRDILAFDALDDLPAKMPVLSAWLDVATLPPPRLRSTNKPLPAAALANLLVMLALSTLDAPYAGVALARDACDPGSLAELAWDVFLGWSLAGYPPKDDWVLAAVGLLGDDACASKLAARIREWPGEGGHARAAKGLDVLAAIGTDMALMHLDAIATKVKFKGLQEKARERITTVAEARGLSRDELADRLVPDLDLDEDGSRTLPFGPRTFRVGWTEQLVPFVTLEGARQKDLPKPQKTDDPALAKQSIAAWKALKKDAKAVASHQVMRLERAMCARRRWDAATFRPFFVMHPLVVHLVRRLVFGVWSEGKLGATFRVAEDRTFADVRDRPVALDPGASIGVVHRLDLDEPSRVAWSEVMASYEIIAPFEQLERETFEPSAVERKMTATKRFEGTTVPLGKVLGLEARGWQRGRPADAGWIWDMQKPLDERVVAVLGLGGGILAGDMRESPAEQKLEGLALVEARTFKAGPTFGELDAVVVSELLRDVQSMA